MNAAAFMLEEESLDDRVEDSEVREETTNADYEARYLAASAENNALAGNYFGAGFRFPDLDRPESVLYAVPGTASAPAAAPANPPTTANYFERNQAGAYAELR